MVFASVAELSRHYPKWGGLLSALPWITLLVIVTSHQFDNASASELVKYLWATFWFILPTLLFVAVMATLLSKDVAFYWALTIAVIATSVANGLVAYLLDASQRTAQ